MIVYIYYFQEVIFKFFSVMDLKKKKSGRKYQRYDNRIKKNPLRVRGPVIVYIRQTFNYDYSAQLVSHFGSFVHRLHG